MEWLEGARLQTQHNQDQPVLTFYGIDGKPLGNYTVNWDTTHIWFEGGGWSASAGFFGLENPNRLQSTGDHYPYGEQKNAYVPSFATYTRDTFTNLDYAINRYYSATKGRFISPDPYQANGGAADPGSWNRYSYVQGDPVNYYDPESLIQRVPEPPPTVPLIPVPPYNPPATPSREHRYDYPECNKGDSRQEDANLKCILAHYGAAQTLAKESGVSAMWLLGWAASESGYGRSAQASRNGNFVNESLPQNGETGEWLKAIRCPDGAVRNWACFNSFSDSLYSALYTEHATWTYADQTNPSGLSVISSVIANNPVSSVAEVFQAVADAGFDPPGTTSNAGYGDRVSAAVRGATKRADCLLTHGYLQ